MTGSAVQLVISPDKKEVVLHLSGVLDFDLARLCIITYNNALNQYRPDRISFDLSQVSSMATAGLGMLAYLRQKAGCGECRLQLCQGCDSLERMLNLAEMGRLYAIDSATVVDPPGGMRQLHTVA